jgi:hypothetical protein
MLTRILPLAALGSLLIATPALADRAGDAPIRAPLTLKTDHIAFTLHGDGWKQRVGALEGTPMLGRYQLDTPLAGGASCTLSASVVARTSAQRPIVRGHTVRLRPSSPSSDVLRVAQEGASAARHWWSGRLKTSPASASVPAAAGVQHLPARLVVGRRRYLIYTITVQPTATTPAGTPVCAALARETIKRIAQSAHIAPGAPLAEPPFIA